MAVINIGPLRCLPNKIKRESRIAFIEELFSQRFCPIHLNNVHMIGGKCYYYEKTKLTPSQAKKNCKSVFGDFKQGKLFEPQSVDESRSIIKKAKDLSYVSGDFIYIGLQKDPKDNKVIYMSSNQKVKFHDFTTDLARTNNARIIAAVTSKDALQWYSADSSYESKGRQSICEMV